MEGINLRTEEVINEMVTENRIKWPILNFEILDDKVVILKNQRYHKEEYLRSVPYGVFKKLYYQHRSKKTDWYTGKYGSKKIIRKNKRYQRLHLNHMLPLHKKYI